LSAEQTVHDPVALCTSSAFVEEVRAWVAARLKPRGSWLTGEWEQPHDLHSNNVCWPGEVDDLSSVRIIDWGDATVGHPFGTMLATLNSIAFQARVLDDDGRIDDLHVLRIRDAYLEPFTGLGNREEPIRWIALARSTGCVTRALAWEGALQDAPAAVVAGLESPFVASGAKTTA
jgi:hypothetical protein